MSRSKAVSKLRMRIVGKFRGNFKFLYDLIERFVWLIIVETVSRMAQKLLASLCLQGVRTQIPTNCRRMVP